MKKLNVKKPVSPTLEVICVEEADDSTFGHVTTILSTVLDMLMTCCDYFLTETERNKRTGTMHAGGR